MRDKTLLRSLMLVMVMMMLVAACSSDESKEGPVTWVNDVNFGSQGVSGTFEVTEGADVLGCSSGTFVDSGNPDVGVQRVQTCDSGSNEGTFTVAFTFDDFTEKGENGTWSVVEGSDDFVGLQGGGDWVIVYPTNPNIGVGTWTGDINYSS